ncbi:hypothetical protein IDJ77_22280 [Mucilaginibacter sp. ZT4R22]|uniref:Uncharacterized protein n=1 Tax=Mucilaginibacter pankratovii TaxID=2772110 RepID=A0ABR7WWI9_9SPHI|nr:hypothetical protein [Mucilaginibacter pankratovii]MBD1366558.1 hypothetical protein [Mucilaginibacter pankratovii]
MYNKDSIIAEMALEGWDTDLDENRDKEKFLLHILRGTDNPKEILAICEAFGSKGSLFTAPVLMARMVTTQREVQSYFMATLAIIMSRMQGWEPDLLNDFFNPSWWPTKWVATKERFISFICILAGADDEGFFNEERMETMAEIFLPEMQVNILPYLSFKELKLLATEWDPKTDMILVANGLQEQMLLSPLYQESGILKEPDQQVSDNISDMRIDYLITRLGLHHELDHYHTMLRMALVLNQA